MYILHIIIGKNDTLIEGQIVNNARAVLCNNTKKCPTIFASFLYTLTDLNFSLSICILSILNTKRNVTCEHMTKVSFNNAKTISWINLSLH